MNPDSSFSDPLDSGRQDSLSDGGQRARTDDHSPLTGSGHDDVRLEPAKTESQGGAVADAGQTDEPTGPSGYTQMDSVDRPDTVGEPATPEVQESPWITFITGKKVRADHFLKNLVTSALPIPSEPEIAEFTSAIGRNHELAVRLLDLLCASSAHSDEVQKVVSDLGLPALAELGLVGWAEIDGQAEFRDCVRGWILSKIRGKLSPQDLKILTGLLKLGAVRNLLDHEGAVNLISLSVPSLKKKGKRPSETPPASRLDSLLEAPPTRSTLVSFLKYSAAVSESLFERDRQIEALNREKSELIELRGNLESEVDRLETLVEELKMIQGARESSIAELERRIVDLRDGSRHKVQQLQGDMRGMLEGRLSRLLQTAVEASRSNPPWNEAIQERLEDALALIEKEAECLRPSE